MSLVCGMSGLRVSMFMQVSFFSVDVFVFQKSSGYRRYENSDSR